ncbi:MAG TPA: GAF domain-containing sensor histidine kinase [Chitinophagaceae bacterium]|nr:GAF domain-containing sensor histidine kinase [Chitinophagaceae bacterium]
MSYTEIDSLIETERIQSLKKYDILDTPPDGSFDRITKLAAELLNVPIAIVTLVDTDRIWFKSRYGLDVQQIGRDPGLCASAILSDDIYEVDDARTDPRTLANPLVASEFGLRFYAAVPLKVKDGHNLGTLCVIDKHPRHLTDIQRRTLQYLADILIDQLELRLAARTAIYQQNQVLSIAAHDLKNPLTTLSVWAELARDAKNDPVQLEKMLNMIKEAGEKMNRLVNDLLESARKEAGKVQIRFASTDIADVVEKVVATNQVLANNKKIKLQFYADSRPCINADEDRLTEIADNLVNNAIKYSPKEKNIFVTIREEDEHAILEIQDEGQGFTEEDKKHLFQRFVKLSAQPTGGESSTGLGLSIVKSLVEAHHGTINIISDGKNKGSTFIIELPVLK